MLDGFSALLKKYCESDTEAIQKQARRLPFAALLAQHLIPTRITPLRFWIPNSTNARCQVRYESSKPRDTHGSTGYRLGDPIH